MTNNTEKPYPSKSNNQDIQQMSQILRETETDKMCKLRR